MMRDLTVHRAGAAPGAARSLVVFVHGYGADGADLLGLAEPLAPHLPAAAFLAPDAPDPCGMNPAGRQWAPIPWIDGTGEVEAARAFAASAADLDAMLDAALAEYGLGPDRLILFGFSQGTMLCLQVAPRRAVPVAGVVGVSGRLLAPERLAEEATSKPQVLLVHGDADDVVPFTSMGEAGEALTAAGFRVYGHVMHGTGHGIAPDGLSVALGFMREALGAD